MANSDKRIIYTQDDGTVAIVIPADKTNLSVEEIRDKDVPTGKTSYIVGFGIDMAKAREIHKTNIRNARTPKLAELDIEFQKALETGASTTDIVAKKQALRDAPADSGIAAASDANALKAQWKTDILGTSPYS